VGEEHRNVPNFGFHIRHGNHSSDHNIDLPDTRAAHKEATMVCGDMARDVAAQLGEMPEWRMDLSDESANLFLGLGLSRSRRTKAASAGGLLWQPGLWLCPRWIWRAGWDP